MAFTKITTGDTANKGVVGLPDTPDMGTSEIQAKFDELATDVIIPKHNALIDELEAGTAGASIGVKDANNQDTTLQARLNDIAAGGYTKTEADGRFLQIDTAAETYLTQSSAESTYLAIEDAPTKVSDLTNDSGYITSASIDSLTDTNISNVSNGQVLKYDSATSKWVNGTDSGATSASGVSYDNTTSELSSTNVQDAIDEVVGDMAKAPTIYEQTLVAGNTSVAFSNVTTTSSSIVEVGTSVAGLDYNSISVSGTTYTVTYDAQASNVTVYLIVSET